MASKASNLVRHKDTVEDIHIAWPRDWLPDDDGHQATSSPDDDEHPATEVFRLLMSSNICNFFWYDWCFLKAFRLDGFRPDSTVKYTQMVALTNLWASANILRFINAPKLGRFVAILVYQDDAPFLHSKLQFCPRLREVALIKASPYVDTSNHPFAADRKVQCHCQRIATF